MTLFDGSYQWTVGFHGRNTTACSARCFFAKDEALKKTEVLSGGRGGACLFLQLMLQKPNVLVFDEPTNHLDLESINALNIALQRYQGTVPW